MTTDNPLPAKTSGKTELKVKAAAYATFAATAVLLSFLGTTATDYVHALPDWLEVPAYSLLLSAITFVSGYATKSKPDSLSASSLAAAQEWLNKKMPRRSL